MTSVLITRRKDPLEGERVQVLRRLRRHDRVDLLVLLADGRKRMIPQAWTDDGEPAVGNDAAQQASALGTVEDLLAAGVLVSALGKRARGEQAAWQSPCEEDDHAACPAHSAPGRVSGATTDRAGPASRSRGGRGGPDAGPADRQSGRRGRGARS